MNECNCAGAVGEADIRSHTHKHTSSHADRRWRPHPAEHTLSCCGGTKGRNPHGNRGLLCSPVTLAIVSPAVFNEQPSLKSICQLHPPPHPPSPPVFHFFTRVEELVASTGVNTAPRCGMCPATAARAARVSLSRLALALATDFSPSFIGQALAASHSSCTLRAWTSAAV